MNYGLQLFSVRDLAQEHYEEALRLVSEMGYTTVEPAGFFGLPASEVATMMKRYGLTVCSTHTSRKEVFENFEATVAYHKAIGCRDIIIPAARFSTAEELDRLVELINHFQPLLEAEGMRLHYHNHDGEFLPNLSGQIAFDELASRTKILFEIDTFWAFNAGRSPLDLMEQYKDRIRFIHLKDGIVQDRKDPESHAIGKSLGSGNAPIEAVRQKAIELGIQIVVESEGLEPTGVEEVKRCIDYLKALDAKKLL